MYKAYITRIKNLRPAVNADRLQLGECFGNTVCVNLNFVDNQLGIYFPSDGQLSVEFATVNNLLRQKDEDGNQTGGYMDPEKRNVKAISLRGNKSDGLFLPIEALVSFGDISTLKEGDCFSTFNGYLICQKYIPRTNPSKNSNKTGNRTRKKKVNVCLHFAEHADTEQLAYNLDVFKPNDEIEITLKMHGTSGRTGYLPILQKLPWWKKLLGKKEEYRYGYISGTRRVVLDNYDGGFYGDNSFRKPHSKFFEGKLWMGETVYYELVGFTTSGQPIMSTCDNKKLKDKEFVKQYGETTVFSYGCHPNGGYNSGRNESQSDMYVYRMTMTTPDGEVIEYSPDFMRYRCEMMGVKTVPVMWKGTIPYTVDDLESSVPGARIMMRDGKAGDWIKKVAEWYYDGPDPIGKTHIREGVVVRVVNRPKFTAYKHKNFEFKVLENIIKEDAIIPDMEEREELIKE